MMKSPDTEMQLSTDGGKLTVHVPFEIRRRGGRKIVISPAGESQFAPNRPRMDSALVVALARAFRWKAMLENGHYPSIIELAAAEKLDRSFVSHVLRLTLLAPKLVEAILDGRQPPTLHLQPLMRGFPEVWAQQSLLA